MSYELTETRARPAPAPRPPAANLIDLLRQTAGARPDELAYTFLLNEGAEEAGVTYGELDRQARSIAARLQSMGARGERVLLLYPAGLDYIAAFFGCLYAGAVAVPTYPPRPNRGLARFQSIVADAQARVVLTTRPILSKVGGLFRQTPELQGLTWVTTDGLADDLAHEWRAPETSGDTLAFLQYTSGSTSDPKGVMVSHGHILHNQGMIQRLFGQTASSVIVGWLPLYHDMGLIGNVLQSLFLGARCVLMSPMAFLQRPLLWLEAITRYRATTSGGPNFAYDLCVRRVTDEQRAKLDLTSWEVAYSGAEPVRHETMENFARAFAACGFRPEAFQPCYGLAESTLVVSGGKRGSLPVLKPVEPEALERHRVIESEGREGARLIVSCGYALPEQKILVVEPVTLTECRPGEVGEIWLAGPSVAGGYWNRPAETAATFHARLADTGEGPYLRTGDLGFLQDGELFVTGRHKDLIIIRGLNYYPHDIELTVERSHAALRPDCAAAFSVNRDGEEQLAIVQEVDPRRQGDLEAVLEAIRQAVSEEHELNAATILLTRPGGVPKTSSGKIRRGACRQMLAAGELDALASWQGGVVEGTRGAAAPAPGGGAEAIRSWLVSLLAARLKLDASKIETDQPLTRYGLDSLTAVDLAHQVEAGLGVNLPMGIFLQGPTVRELAARVAEQLADPPADLGRLTAGPEPASECPLSFGQKSIWFMERFAPESGAYNIARAVRFYGPLDAGALRRTFQSLTARHASLRTSFHTSQGEPFQKIHEQVQLPFEEVDASAWSEDFMRGSLAEAAHQPFDLERAPLLRVRLLKSLPEEHVLLLVVHHIVADLWSLVVLLKELFTLYEAETSGAAATLPPLAVGYADYVRWQEEMIGGAEGERHWAYWQAQLSGELPLLNLPTARPRPAFRAYRGGASRFKLDAGLRDRLKALSRARGVTLYMTLLAAFNLLLYRYTGQADQLVGTSAAGRSRPELSPLVGYFVNPVAMRTDLAGDPTFERLLDRVRSVVLAAFEHQDYPFPLLVERLQPERTADRSPLFDLMFVLQKSQLLDDSELAPFALEEAGAKRKVGGFLLEPVPVERRTAQFDLSLVVAETDDGLLASFEYDAELFDAEAIGRLAAHYGNLLAAAAADPARRISSLPLLSPEEEHEMLVGWNSTAREYPRGRCIHEQFEEQAERTPQAVALAFDGRLMSYAELNRLANRLANRLRALGVGPEAPVAVLLERSPEMIVSIVAILKAGGAYVPLDPDYPTERLADMLEDSGAAVLLTRPGLSERLPGRTARLFLPDADGAAPTPESEQPPANSASADNLSYVLYTSGSTGRPKGVCCHHAGVLNLLADFERRSPLAAGDNCSLWTSLSFDVSVYEIFSALLAGATLHLAPGEMRTDFNAFAEWLSDHRITSAYLPPSMLPEFAEELKRESRPYELKRLLVGVEPINEKVLASISQSLPALRIINGYGPTEATVCATLYELQPLKAENRNTPIGRPTQNTRVYLLDAHLQPVPVGAAGELYIGGAGVARGYLNRPGLTAERFTPDPFGAAAGGRLYRTGDVARRGAGGELEYLGRLDTQVKLRGFRIELGEIEAVLCEQAGVAAAAVVAVAGAGGPRLMAYVAAAGGAAAVGAGELRAHLRGRLPSYMSPTQILVLDALPLTPNGKVDRKALKALKALPAPAGSGSGAGGRALTAVEEVVAGVWREVLGVGEAGAEDDFFELGGHSLLATKAVSRLRDIFHVELALRTLFSNPTVAGVAEAVEEALQNGAAQQQPRIARVERHSFRVRETQTGTLLIPEDIRRRL